MLALATGPGVERRTPMPKKIAKKRAEALTGFDRQRLHSLDEAVGVVQKLAYAKFDESVDIAVRLGVNPKHADQMVRGAVVLPHGTGKTVRVAVFAKGDKEKEARDAGADFAGADDLVAQASSESAAQTIRTAEEWRQVPGYSTYEVSDLGRVRRCVSARGWGQATC